MLAKSPREVALPVEIGCPLVELLSLFPWRLWVAPFHHSLKRLRSLGPVVNTLDMLNGIFTMPWRYQFPSIGWSFRCDLWLIGRLWKQLGCQWCCPTRYITISSNLCYFVQNEISLWFDCVRIDPSFFNEAYGNIKESRKLERDNRAIGKFWGHCCSAGFLQADHPGRGKNPVGIYGDDCRYNKAREKLVALNFNCILQEPRSIWMGLKTNFDVFWMVLPT